MHFAFPFRLDAGVRTALADDAQHVRDLMEEVLFTAPGERVNRPTFGTGLLQAVFAPGGPEVAATTRALVQASLQQWVGMLANIESVDVRAHESTLEVVVRYRLRGSASTQTARYERRV